MRFTKMQAFGNDYVYIDAINQDLPDLPSLARFVSDRHFAIGSDGMVLICPSDIADFRMRMFNPDGTEGEMCGNALRSVGKYVYDHALTDKTELMIETLGGIKHLWLTVDMREPCDGEREMPHKNRGFVSNIRANIGKPVLDTALIPVLTEKVEFIEQPVDILDKKFNITAVSWGNPHTAMFVDDLYFDVHKYGRAIEYKTDLFPNKTNVTFAQVVARDYIKIREWERGTGETIGCGTGCATAVVAGVLTGRCDRTVTVEQIGGPLLIEWDEESGEMFMTGPSHNVFEGDIDITHLGE